MAQGRNDHFVSDVVVFINQVRRAENVIWRLSQLDSVSCIVEQVKAPKMDETR